MNAGAIARVNVFARSPAAYLVVIALALLAVLPLFAGNFAITLLNEIGIGALVALGLVLLTGVGGATSFGQAAFVGIGAYTTGWLSTTQAWSPWFGLIAALLVTGLAALLIGLLTLRLGGHFLPLSTIAWGLSIAMVFGNIEALGRHAGMPNIPALSIGSISLAEPRAAYWLIWLLVALASWFCANLLDSRTGRAMRGLRGGALLLGSVGASALWIRLQLFVLAALLAGLAGWLYAHVNRFVSPSPFDVRASIDYLLMAVAGGLGHLWGAVIGSAFVLLVRNGLQDVLPRLVTHGEQLDSVAFAILFIVLMQYARGGVAALVSHITRGMFAAKPGEPALKPGEPTMTRNVPAGTPSALINVDPLPSRQMPTVGQSVLSVRGAVKRFGGLVAVNQVGFDIHAGEIVGLIGPNGAGKSTLFNLITGASSMTAGRVEFAGRDITGMAQPRIARLGIARTFQHVKLRGRMSLLDNVALGAYARTANGMLAAGLRLDRVAEARIRAQAFHHLERVGLADRAMAPAENLPFGMQRLAEIARALAADPLMLILDEPAAGLRRHEKQELGGLLRKLRDEGLTILIVEHDMELVMQVVDRLIVMNFGSKIFEGLPAAARAESAVLDAYLGST